MTEAASAIPQLPRVHSERDSVGLVVLRASRLEALVPPLADLLDATWPENPLQPQTVIAAHPGIKPWLVGELARRAGQGGIVANLDVVLPSTWLDREASLRLGRNAVALPAYQREQLRWRVDEALRDPSRVPVLTDTRIERLLAVDDAGEAALRRFQLADRLARLYAQYLVYRPDWLRAWEHGRFDVATARLGEAGWRDSERKLLAPLWRWLVERAGTHRAAVTEALVEALHQPDNGTRQALHVFGTSHLAPRELEALRAYAEHALVALYLPDPCNEYWDVLAADASADAWRTTEEQLVDAAGGGDWFHPQSHPLLARWGRLGQQFFSAIADGPLREDIRHHADLDEAPPKNLLERVQASIRRLEPASITFHADAAEDASLRVHRCHTPLRELEVLRDVLLDARTGGIDGKPIEPGEMLVMAPDITRYLPLLPAVFGRPGDARADLPYHTADAPMASTHPLFNAFARLLEVAGSRITAPAIADLLALPEIARRLGLDDEDRDALLRTLAESRAAWALDARHRAGFGVPGHPANSLGWAMDRMLAGYLVSDAPSPDSETLLELADGETLLPLGGLHGPQAAALGALDGLLGILQELQSWQQQTYKASEWARRLGILASQALRVDPQDAAAREAFDALAQMFRAIASEPAAADLDPVLHWQVVAERLRQQLASVPERQPFLLGGITFCGMVPRRSIPFRLIAVLGLDEGEFPRSVPDAGLDLMARLPRMGDREQRSDDRYLFLETLMAAREQLHLFHVGEGAHDGKPRNPAAPLAELMEVLDAAAGIPADASPAERDAARTWQLEHPLQPFDARAFDPGQPALQSHARHLLPLQRGEGMTAAAAPRFAPQATGDENEPLPSPISLQALHRYFRDPGRDLLERRLGLSFDALADDRLPEHEPLEPAIPRIEGIARRLLFEVLLPQQPLAEEDVPMPRSLAHGGLLPAGRIGEQAWLRERGEAWHLYQATRARGWLPAAGMQAQASVLSAIDGLPVVEGEVAAVYPQADGHLLLRSVGAVLDAKKNAFTLHKEADIHFGKRIPIFLDWALLRLATGANDARALRLGLLVAEDKAPWSEAINAWDARFVVAPPDSRGAMAAALRGRVLGLLAHWHRADGRRYFPRSSWAMVGKGDARMFTNSFEGGRHPMGEADYGAGQLRWLARGGDWGNEGHDLAELSRVAKELNALIDLTDAGEGA